MSRNRVPEGLRSLTLLARDVAPGDVIEDPDSGAIGEVTAVHLGPRLVIIEIRDALDWRLEPRSLVRLRWRAW